MDYDYSSCAAVAWVVDNVARREAKVDLCQKHINGIIKQFSLPADHLPA